MKISRFISACAGVAVLLSLAACGTAPAGPTATQAGKTEVLWLGVWKNAVTGKDETHVGGEPMGFIIELENGFRIYHMGDTGLGANPLRKGTPAAFIQALGATSTRGLPLGPGEKAEF